MQNLGATRSSLKADHLLQTPDTFIRTPLPGAEGVEFIVHCGPRLGAGFTQITAEFAAGGSLGSIDYGIERFVYVIEGELGLTVGDDKYTLAAGGFAFLPQGVEHSLTATTASKAVLIEKPWEDAPDAAEVIVGNEADQPSTALGGDADLQVRKLIPDGAAYDMAVNTMTYAPGATLSQVEIHVMEHGLLMLEGGGIYRLGDNWYPVTSGDFIWMAPYCPQWFGALGKAPAKYLIYKDWNRHPL
jgi:(S)-ureidoglycine aminohydrolase